MLTADPMSASICALSASILAFACSTVISALLICWTISADCSAALFANLCVIGRMSSKVSSSSLLTVPPIAIVFFRAATSCSVCIPSVAINAWNLAASPGTIPVDIFFTLVRPSTFGSLSCIYI